MVLSAIFGKKKMKPGQLTQQEKYEAISINPELSNADSARYIYYNAKKLPKSVTKRKHAFREQEMREKKEKEISRRTQRLYNTSQLRKKVISNRKTTSTDEYGTNIINKNTNEDIDEFLRRANIDTKKHSSQSKSGGKKKTRKRMNRKKLFHPSIE
jgi:hypothetical protein